MSNEFVAKNGLISNGNLSVNGTLSATGELNIGNVTDLASTIYSNENNLYLSAVNTINLLNDVTITGTLDLSGSTIVNDATLTDEFLTLYVNGSALAIPLYLY